MIVDCSDQGEKIKHVGRWSFSKSVPLYGSNGHRGMIILNMETIRIFWVRGRAIGKGINSRDFGIRN